MKNHLIILFAAMLSISCVRTDSVEQWEKARSAASIVDYQDYLLDYPKTKHIREITDSLRVLWQIELADDWHWQCHTCIEIYIDSSESILLGYEKLSREQLTDTVAYLIFNPDFLPYLPQMKQVINSDSVAISVPNYALDILTSPLVSEKRYSEVLISVLAAFNGIKNELSEFFYHKEYESLTPNQQSSIDEYIPINIRFERAPNEEVKSELYELDKRLFGG